MSLPINQIIAGDALAVMRTWPDQCIQTCVTSPPYWGLRDYGVEGQLGLEKTPEEYVSKMVEVFQGVWRVLRDDGTLWLNLGDSYTSNLYTRQGKPRNVCQPPNDWQGTELGGRQRSKHVKVTQQSTPGLKPKDLCGIPWRVALALQADGWYLRQDIIWYKPNPMPESVTDRCTKSHEYIFLLTKKPQYFYDAEAIKEPSTQQTGQAASFKRDTKDHIIPNQSATQHRLNRDDSTDNGARNKRSVWVVSTQPCKEAHSATFPPKLIEPCILAGSKKGDVVFDPFMGSGTTAIVAIQRGRNYVGIELSPEYIAIAEKRIAAVNTGVPDKETENGQGALFA